jgi:hypothetical protein
VESDKGWRVAKRGREIRSADAAGNPEERKTESGVVCWAVPPASRPTNGGVSFYFGGAAEVFTF